MTLANDTRLLAAIGSQRRQSTAECGGSSLAEGTCDAAKGSICLLTCLEADRRSGGLKNRGPERKYRLVERPIGHFGERDVEGAGTGYQA